METKSNTAAATDGSPTLLAAILGSSLLFQVYQLQGQPWALLYVVVTYANLLLFFWCINQHDKYPEGSRRRKVLKAAVWFLSSSLLTLMSYRASQIMPFAMKAVMWSIVGTTISVTAYGFFIYRESPDAEPAGVRGRCALEP